MNKQSIWGWQGNNLSYPETTWIYSFIILFLAYILIFVFKNKLSASRDIKKKVFWIFPNYVWFWRVIGIIGWIVIICRVVLNVVSGFPLYWENLDLHLCRLHITLVMTILVIGKLEWMKNILFLCVIGAFFGLFFLNMNTPEFNEYIESGKTLPMPELNMLEQQMLLKGFDWQHVGVDSIVYWESILSHLFMGIVPVYLFTFLGLKWDFLSIIRIHIAYLFMVIFVWVFDIWMSYLPDKGWHANFWYIGPDDVNDFKGALGPLSGWPQNIFSYYFLGVIVIWSFIGIWILQSKFVLFESRKSIFIKRDSLHRKEFNKSFHDFKFQQIFAKKRN